MIGNDRSQQVRKGVLVGIVVLVWLAALVFYWSVAPRNASIHFLAGIFLSYLFLWSLAFLLSNVSKIEIAQRFLLTSISVALTVGLLEVLTLTRTADFRLVFGTPISEPWRHPDNLLDPKLLHVLKPHHRTQYGGIDYRFDQHGLRNEVDLEAADVVVTGDSFIEGWNVSATDLLTSQLAKQLGRTVANLGRSWYGPQQELELLRRYGLQLHPKVCVWSFYEGNDLWDVRRYNSAIRNWEKFSKGLHSFKQRSFTRNAVLAMRRIVDTLQHRDAAHDAKLKRIPSGRFKGHDGRETRMYFLDDSPPSAEDYEALEEVRSILSQAYELCRADGARFLVIFIPTKFRVYSGFTRFDANARPSNVAMSDLPKRLEAIVREALPDGGFLDLTPVLVEEARHGRVTYFPGYDTHWSPEGHRIAATAIAQFLKKWE